jgi:hypothetical protein
VHQPDTTPARGTGDICLSPDGKPSRAGKSRTSFDSSFPGFPGLSHTGVRQVFHADALSCVLSMNVQMLRLRVGNVTSLFFTRCYRKPVWVQRVNIFAHRLFTEVARRIPSGAHDKAAQECRFQTERTDSARNTCLTSPDCAAALVVLSCRVLKSFRFTRSLLR